MNCPFPVIQCNKCKSILIACSKNFHKAKRCKYGFRPQCKVCRNKENKIYREENKDEINKRRKIYREENKEIISERDKKYRINNKEKVRIRKHKYYINNSEYIKNKSKNWHKNNPEKVFNSHSKRREKEENQGSGFTKEQWKEMMDFFEDLKREKTPPYAVFQAKDGDTVVTLYESGKIVFQGRDADLASDIWVATEKMNNKNVEINLDFF